MVSTLEARYAKAGMCLSGNKRNKTDNLAISILDTESTMHKSWAVSVRGPKSTLWRSWDDSTLDKGDTVLKIPCPFAWGTGQGRRGDHG